MRRRNHKTPFLISVFITIFGIFCSTNIVVYGVELLPFPQRPQTQQQIPESADDRLFLSRIGALSCPDLYKLRDGLEKLFSSASEPRNKNYYLNYLRMINNVISAKNCSPK
jgi:hypothetical protein